MEVFLRSFASGAPVGIMALSERVFGQRIRTDVMHRAVLYESAWRLQGTESSKALGQVRGSTRKPFPQKGRGKARVGTLRAAHFVGGYAVHGPKPGPHMPDINTKVYDAAIRSALSTKYEQNQLVVVDSLTLPNDSKFSLLERLASLGIDGKKAYLMHGDREPQPVLVRAADKFTVKPKSETAPNGEKRLLVTSADLISVLPVLENEMLVLDKAAVELLEELYFVD
ncbi:ribosomal protein L4/L1 family protein [Chytriomyces sp. MP71]|nr:ribosomal protein L4/L1 family protein [Chytriomyces sp. MP71]